MRSLSKLLCILILLSGCSSTDEDEDIICETGPVGFTFEVVDEATGENLFANGGYQENQLQIVDKDGKTVDFDYEPERDVVDVLLGWEPKSDVFTVTLGQEIEFDIVFTLEESSSGGCTSTWIKELEIEGATYETNETGDITTILVTDFSSEASIH